MASNSNGILVLIAIKIGISDEHGIRLDYSALGTSGIFQSVEQVVDVVNIQAEAASCSCHQELENRFGRLDFIFVSEHGRK